MPTTRATAASVRADSQSIPPGTSPLGVQPTIPEERVEELEEPPAGVQGEQELLQEETQNLGLRIRGAAAANRAQTGPTQDNSLSELEELRAWLKTTEEREELSALWEIRRNTCCSLIKPTKARSPNHVSKTQQSPIQQAHCSSKARDSLSWMPTWVGLKQVMLDALGTPAERRQAAYEALKRCRQRTGDPPTNLLDYLRPLWEELGELHSPEMQVLEFTAALHDNIQRDLYLILYERRSTILAVEEQANIISQRLYPRSTHKPGKPQPSNSKNNKGGKNPRKHQKSPSGSEGDRKTPKNPKFRKKGRFVPKNANAN
ncbi:hypothetical protein EJ07DRAFT_154628 [Lizonia empirigonia]|nr:hypothetical protein EJ07DRAFT_154628 [Lizonia empirigonia]